MLEAPFPELDDLLTMIGRGRHLSIIEASRRRGAYLASVCAGRSKSALVFR
jgi:hypothetical protein